MAFLNVPRPKRASRLSGGGGGPDAKSSPLSFLSATMLSAKNRLTSQSDFRRVYAARQSFSVPGLRLNRSLNGSDRSRFGIVVPKKSVKLATDRNRLKRLVREALRPLAREVSPGFDTVINCQAGCPDNLADISRSVAQLLRKSKLLK